MRVIHRYGIRADRSQRHRLETLGVGSIAEIPGSPRPLLTFDVAEDHPQWEAIRELTRELTASDIVRTEFAASEMDRAKWLGVLPAWHHGYPQPREEEFGYLDATYDLTDYCRECGTGARQKAPFRMKREPRWGNRSILQLNWVFDEYFVKPAAWATVFEPFGIGQTAVLGVRGEELNTVRQLVVEESVDLDVTGLPFETCASCGQPKYLPVARGPLPPLKSAPVGHMAKSNQYFGSGGRAFHVVIASGSLGVAIRRNGVRGVSFVPLRGDPNDTVTG
jgi:hypothetical protein